MARIGLFSDSHGNIANLYSLKSRLGQLDSMFHLGDIVSDAPRIAQELNTGFVCVRGNCDPYGSEAAEKIITWDKHRILLVHGHMYGSLLSLFYKAESEQCDIVCCGHTHVAVIEKSKDILLINPGSLSLPRGGQKPSCAVLSIHADAVDAEIIHV